MAKAETVEIEETPVQPIPSRSKLLIILAFAAVVLLEMILLLFFLPKSAVPTANNGADDPEGIPKIEIDSGPTVKPGDWVEFPIPDPFTCMVVSDEDGGAGYMVNAKITLKCEKAKETKFTDLFDKVKGDIKGQISTILRSSKVPDLQDANNTRIKNRIQQKINEIFGEPLVKQVVIESFNATPM